MVLGLCLIFFVSGASALVFETLWFRAAGLTLGNSLWASSIVLASFMAGLALGNALAVRYGPRVKRPLAAYAGIEVSIGVTGLGLVLLFPLLTPLLAPLFRLFLETPLVLNSLRLLIAFTLLLIPSTAMGFTLPLLVKTLSTRDSNFGRVLGRLYGWNTLGAMAGALGGEVFLIGALGIRGTALLAAFLNFSVALCVLVLAPAFRRDGAGSVSNSDGALARPLRKSKRLLLAAFVSGGALLGLEIVWFRFMLLFINGTSLAFAGMLAVVLFGIAAGGFIASWWLKLRPLAYRWVPLVALASGAITVFTYISLVEPLGILSMVPVSVLSGVLFIFLGRAVEDDVVDKTKAAAGLTFANTLGAMFGALVAGFVLIPWLGVEISFFILAMAYGGVAVLSLRAGHRASSRTRGEWRTFQLAAAAYVLLLVFFPFGLMTNHYFPTVLRPYMADGAVPVATREGLTEVAFLLRKDLWGQPGFHRLITNGFPMSANTFLAKRYMRLFVYWPMALHPSPTRALLVCYGIGVTAKALTNARSLESIDIVDVSRNLIELSRDYSPFPGDHPLEDPRVSIHIEDGRLFLQTTDRTFDLITAEPPPPKNAGIVNLYTLEYFQLLHERLTPGGVVTYWLPVYQLSVEESKAIVKGFCQAFRDCSMWTGAGTEWMLVGTRGLRGPVQEAGFRRLWQEPGLGSGLRSIGIERPEQLGALFIGDSEFLADWTRDTLPLEDDHPHRIYPTSLGGDGGDEDPMDEYLQVMEVTETRRRFETSEWITRTWPHEIREATLDYFTYQGFLNQHLEMGGAGVAALYSILTQSELQSLPLILMGSQEEDASLVEGAVARGVVDPMLDYLLAARAMSRRDYESAARLLGQALRQDPESKELARLQILALVLAGHRDDATASARALRAREREPADPRFWSWLESVLDDWIQTSDAPASDSQHR